MGNISQNYQQWIIVEYDSFLLFIQDRLNLIFSIAKTKTLSIRFNKK